jgi:hypothetical protein
LDIIPAWVRISGLPLILWFEQVFEETENDLGIYYEDNLPYKESIYMGLACILVGLHLSKGLVESIQIWRELNPYHINLDYEGNPSYADGAIAMGIWKHNSLSQSLGKYGYKRRIHLWERKISKNEFQTENI